MSADQLAARILQRLPGLAPQLLQGARFLIDHPDVVATSSMRQVAERVGVSPATLVRLARALNFSDWSELRDSYVGQFRQSAPHYAQKADSLVQRGGVSGLIQEVQRAQRLTLEHCVAANAATDIDEAARLLNRAPRIFVAGFMSCRAPALAFAYICGLFRSDVHLLGSAGSALVAELEDIRVSDAVLAINFRPYAREIHLIAAALERCRAPLISIADSRITPVAPFARCILLFGADSPSFFPSILPAVALVESLAAAMLSHAGPRAAQRVSVVERALYASGTYCA